MKKFAFLAVIIVFFMASFSNSAQGAQRKPYVYAWSEADGVPTIYVSDRVAPAETISGDREARERWKRALQRHGVDQRLCCTWVGMPRVTYDFGEADGMRLDFVEKQRRAGQHVVLVPW